MNKTRILPPTCLFISLAGMVLLNLFMPVVTLIPYPWNATGLIPMAVGMALNTIAGKAFIKSGNSIRAFERPEKLLTSGVYKYSRNPMYLGMVLILVGVAVLLGTLSPFIIAPMFAITMDRVFVIAEEEILEQHFGEQWTQYRAEVRRWL